MDPSQRQASARTSRTFDALASDGWGPEMERDHLRTAGALLHRLPLEQGRIFLDLGCGNGWAAHRAASTGAGAIGVDLSRPLLVEARDRQVPGDPVIWVQADLQALPLADESVDLAFS
ncbi:MAG: class I SAM-dependent methyltransferase, partial [Candidatus Thermoplasmatota archaeon]|nr:class I SAM-dependent methyltransferase [Candidatus Thermoplasmatota archaeon]